MLTSKTIKYLFVFTLINSSIFMAYGQTPSILISGYTFTTGKNEVGVISFASEDVKVKKASLKGKAAKAFTLTNGNRLTIRPAFNKPEARWYDLIIEAETTHGKLSEAFRIVNDHFIRNKVIAHRGAWKNTNTSENSIAALKHAIDLGCEGSEFDVRMSADSVLFINHDPEIQGIVIEKTPAEQLAKIKLSNGENLPTLEAYLKEGMRQNKTRLILEIKPTASGKDHMLTITEAVIKLVRKLKAQAWTDYISFSYDACEEVRRLDPYAHIAYLNGDKSPQEIAADNLWGLDYHYSVFQKNKTWIDEAQKLNLTLNAWTVNEAEVMKWLLDENVEFITTNEPELLLSLVSKEK